VAVLEQAGYRVLVARDGEEALELFDREGGSVDLFILDVVMPRKSGRVVFETIRAERPAARVLFCSGYSASQLTSADLPEAGPEMLQKPLSGKELLRKVREVLES
jgi:two-component system cell cycle sensor histidine kinase/response regulator CckA